MRLTAIRMINAPSLANQLMMFLKPLMDKDMYSRVIVVPIPLNKIINNIAQLQISVHPVNDIESVYKTIPKEYFAKDLGGKAPSFEELKSTSDKITIRCTRDTKLEHDFAF